MTTEANGLGQFVDMLATALAEKLSAKMPSNGTVEAKLLDLKQAGIFLGRTGPGVRGLITSGQIPAVAVKKIGGRVFLVKKTLEEWVNAQ